MDNQYSASDLQEMSGIWMERIQKRISARKQGWGSDASGAEEAYACESDSETGLDFNIIYSNVETTVPAVFNSMPVPDIRERFRQGDSVAREAADVLERAVSVQIDDGRLDIEVEDVTRDALVAGRGILRVKFDANDDGEVVRGERITYQAVAWRDYLEGEATRFDEVPWIAFRHHLPIEEVERNSDKEMVAIQAVPGDEDEKTGNITVWEVWCKSTRTVKFFREDNAQAMSIHDDPFGLEGFFPVCKPIQPITLTGTRDPVVPYKAYKKLALELDGITKRIRAITSGLKARGILLTGADDLQRLAGADDNEIITGSNLEGLAQIGLEKAILWWPVDRLIVVLRELYTIREQTKQAVYEITGISDIVRGASDSRETASAQQIKTQWGSLRIKRIQAMVERLVRDAFVMTVELVATKFSAETLQETVGMQLQPEVLELIQNPRRNYRIDVESDSTVRGDLTRQKSEMSEFLRGTAEFFSVMQNVVAASPQTAGPLIALYASFARQFNLGRQAETALDELVDMASQAAQQPPPNPGAAESEMKAEEAKAKLQIEGQKLAMDNQRMQAEMQGREVDNSIAVEKLKLEREKAEAEIAMRHRQLEADLELKGLDVLLKRAELALKSQEQDRKDFQAEVSAQNAVAEIALEADQKRAVAIDGPTDN